MAPSPRKPKDFLSFGFALLLKPPRLPRRSFNLHPQRAGREVHTMVVTLRQIISEVRAAPTLEDALAVIIQQVKKAIRIDACAVYLTDGERDDCVLAAAEELPPDLIGRTRVRLGEGLVGRVAERKELIVDMDASAHPIRRLLTDTSHQRDVSFLCTPLIHYRRLLGVLVAWKPAQQPYARDEVTFFLSLAAQPAKAVHDAEAIGAANALLGGEQNGIEAIGLRALADALIKAS